MPFLLFSQPKSPPFCRAINLHTQTRLMRMETASGFLKPSRSARWIYFHCSQPAIEAAFPLIFFFSNQFILFLFPATLALHARYGRVPAVLVVSLHICGLVDHLLGLFGAIAQQVFRKSRCCCPANSSTVNSSSPVLQFQSHLSSIAQLICLVGLSLNMSNVIGYTKCSRDAAKNVKEYATNYVATRLGQQIMSRMFSSDSNAPAQNSAASAASAPKGSTSSATSGQLPR